MARPSRQHEGRLEILEAGARFSAQHGYHGMSMRDLAGAMGKSIAGFYNYYRSKEDVLFELQRRAFETLLESAQAAIDAAEHPRERLYAFILQHLQYVASHPDVMHVLVQEAGALPAERRQAIRASKERYFQMALKLVEDVVDSRPSPSRRPRRRVGRTELERMTYALFGMINWTYGWYRPEQHGSPEQLARTIYGISLRGLRPEHPSDPQLATVEARLAALQRPPLLDAMKRRAS